MCGLVRKKYLTRTSFPCANLASEAGRAPRAKPSKQCASPVRAAFDLCPRAKRSVDPIRVATAAAPRRAAIADVPAIDDNTGDDVDQFVNVTHAMPIGIASGDH
jgi:hypothetical protein